MCGIVGYIGTNNAQSVVINGLKRLEYRGYDSAGMALLQESTYKMYKEQGRINNLERITGNLTSSVGFGHTRWATHGKVTAINAHPHQSASGRFVVVHNGVIDNYKELKETYIPDASLLSETDTEVLAHLIEHFARNATSEQAIMHVLSLIEGSYAIVVADGENPGTLYAAKHKSPLLIGQGPKGRVVGSDMVALLDVAEEYMPLDDQTFVRLDEQNITIHDIKGNPLDFAFKPFTLDHVDADKGPFEHFMLKEIHEQPAVMRRILNEYFNASAHAKIDDALIKRMRDKRIHILAAGTSMHAGLVGKTLFESMAHQPVEVHIASEFAHNPPLIGDDAFFVLISQSGETADLRACLSDVAHRGYPSLTLTNVPTSTLARESDYALALHAGPEIAVASTKAYSAQVGVLAIVANTLGGEQLDIKQALSDAAVSMESVLSDVSHLEAMPATHLQSRTAFYIGRGLDYAVALEAALKLKEISYIQTEGFAAGELKHGTLALIEEDTPVIALITNKAIAANTRSNLSEVEARGGKPFIIATESVAKKTDECVVRDVHPLLTPLISIIPAQLISYYAAKALGNDIDKPRNLAKSVTVE